MEKVLCKQSVPIEIADQLSLHPSTKDCLCEKQCLGGGDVVTFPQLYRERDYEILPAISRFSHADGSGDELDQVETEDLETLPSGAKQSKEIEGYIHISPHALKLLAAVRKYGVDKYGSSNHLGIPIESHLDHAIAHIYKFYNNVPSEHNLLGDNASVEHLGHALCRLTMAIDVYVKSVNQSLEAGESVG